MITIEFQKRKETKNKVRYEEITGDGTPAVCETLYVHKEAIKELGDPDQLKVTIVGEDE